jgi:hypothetical protein
MSFENMILSENFIEAMTFLKAMKDQGFIVHEDEVAGEYKVASARGNALYKNTEEKVYGYFLTGINDRMLIEQKYTEHCMVVLKHTDSVAEKLNRFYGMIYGNTNSYMDFAFGIKGEDYFDLVDHYKVEYKYVQNENINAIGIFIDLNRVDIATKPVINSSSDVSRQMIESRLKAISEQRKAGEGAKKYINTDLAYSIDFDIYDYEAAKVMGHNGNIRKLITDIMTDNIPIENAVAEYKQSMELIGFLEDLERINNR